MEMDTKDKFHAASKSTLVLIAETMVQREFIKEMLLAIPVKQRPALANSIRARCEWILSRTFEGKEPSPLRLEIEANITKLLIEIQTSRT